MPEKYDAIIIGSGIGGLVCGCYLAKAGLKVLIVEQHDKPGGCCSSFKRGKYSFDAGAHYLGGVRKGGFCDILDEIEIKESLKVNQFDPVEKIVLSNGTTIIVRANQRDTIDELKRVFPAESVGIEKLINYILQNDLITLYKKTYNMTFKDMLCNFITDRDLISFFSALTISNQGLPVNRIAAISTIILLREYIFDPGYYPVGGMCKFPEALVERFIQLGGEIMFSTRVDKIINKNIEVSGIATDKNKYYNSKIVVSNADATETLNMLTNSNKNEINKIKRLKPSISFFTIFLKMKENYNPTAFDDVYISSHYFTKYPSHNTKKDIEKDDVKWIMTAMPMHAGIVHKKHTLKIITTAEYVSEIFWMKYREKYAVKIMKEVYKLRPGLKEYIDKDIIGTPVTIKNYTRNRCGAAFGWEASRNQLNSSLCNSLSFVKGLYLAGHWVTTGMGQGGVSRVAFSGRIVAERIIKENHFN